MIKKLCGIQEITFWGTLKKKVKKWPKLQWICNILTEHSINPIHIYVLLWPPFYNIHQVWQKTTLNMTNIYLNFYKWLPWCPIWQPPGPDAVIKHNTAWQLSSHCVASVDGRRQTGNCSICKHDQHNNKAMLQMETREIYTEHQSLPCIQSRTTAGADGAWHLNSYAERATIEIGGLIHQNCAWFIPFTCHEGGAAPLNPCPSRSCPLSTGYIITKQLQGTKRMRNVQMWRWLMMMYPGLRDVNQARSGMDQSDSSEEWLHPHDSLQVIWI